MLAFVTSLRARSLAQDWDYHVWLLQRTLDSILAQTDPDIRVFIVCHDVPDVPQAADSRVRVMPVSFAPPRREFWDMTVDKGLKISAGAAEAIREGADFLMYTDADDLVSRNLAAHVKAHPASNGWYFDAGYAYRHGRRTALIRDDHVMKCGTCAIVRASLLTFETQEEYRGHSVETFAAAGHQFYRSFMQKRGTPLERLPFPGSTYIEHRDSTITIGAGDETAARRRPLHRRVLSRVRHLASHLPSTRLVTVAMREEFTIPRRSDIPAAYL